MKTEIESTIDLSGEDRAKLTAILEDLTGLAKKHGLTIEGVIETQLPSFLLWNGQVRATFYGPAAKIKIEGRSG